MRLMYLYVGVFLSTGASASDAAQPKTTAKEVQERYLRQIEEALGQVQRANKEAADRQREYQSRNVKDPPVDSDSSGGAAARVCRETNDFDRGKICPKKPAVTPTPGDVVGPGGHGPETTGGHQDGPQSGGVSTTDLSIPPKGTPPPGKGVIRGGPMMIGKCRAEQVEVTYSLTAMMGEPWPSARFTWSGKPCTVPAGATALYLKVQKGRSYGWLRFPVGQTSPGGPPAGGLGSAFWESLVCSFNGTKTGECLDRRAAQMLYFGGKVVGFTFGNA